MSSMRNIYFGISLLVLVSCGQGCRDTKPDILLIEHRASEIQVDGNIEESEWNNATTITDLCSPWVPTAKDHTVFKCFHSRQYFNFYFSVIDKTITCKDSKDEFVVTEGDRVEIFFSPTPDLNKYYCIEIAPNGNTLDYAAQFYRKFDYSWDFEHLAVISRITPAGYVVEGRVSLIELEKLHIDFKKGFYLGIFRADFTEENEDSVIWYSWKHPRVTNPDFHIPSAFGKCKLNKFKIGF